jgi:hypothetical protein
VYFTTAAASCQIPKRSVAFDVLHRFTDKLAVSATPAHPSCGMCLAAGHKKPLVWLAVHPPIEFAWLALHVADVARKQQATPSFVNPTRSSFRASCSPAHKNIILLYETEFVNTQFQFRANAFRRRSSSPATTLAILKHLS